MTVLVRLAIGPVTLGATVCCPLVNPQPLQEETVITAEEALMAVALGKDKVVLFMVVVPVLVPKLMAVAAPPRFKVVAVVLARAKVVESVRSEVVMVGEVIAGEVKVLLVRV